MYLIGIDISKFKHDCFIATETGEVIYESFSFNNDSYGFSQLLMILHSLDPTKEKRIGMEATGHYGNNLMRFLHDNKLSFMVLNPYLTEKYRQATSLRKTKTDKIDAHIISKMLLFLDYQTYSSKSYHISSLKSLTRFRFRMIEARTKLKMRVQNILDLTFPEFSKYFSTIFGALPMRILSNYPSPEKLARIDVLSIYEKIKVGIRGSYSFQKFSNLINEAKTTIGKSNENYELELISSLRLINDYNDEIEKTETQIEAIMNQYGYKILTIPGIGIQSAAVIISEYGNFSHYDNSDKMLSFAGLEPSVSQSGTQSFNGHMVKRGSPHLRYTLMTVAMTVFKNNPVFAAYYWKKRNEGKYHRVALSHVVKKLLRIIHYLEINNCNFDPELLK
jgi:transposase